ncbi:fatty acyl-AMP ligase [Lentzea sp. NBC_00516]|uniref:fatty acyl-AMP ligase n=1 Tax=Lentzea sp. NBC_00516 TaxID=2903582 RepID=UPI002E7FF744|nr:fatty acyl-AMP ligase [Lentzea sp. NBC_00516]WUD28589.1 fatty acyl-AMP ligase [Lentzea sp. NBC_00516]
MVNGTLPSVLNGCVERDSTSAALIYMSDLGDYRIKTYSELDSSVRAVAAWLREHCSQGDRVLLLHPAGLEFGAAFFGSCYAGTIAVPAPVPGRYQHERRRLAGIARSAGVRVVLTDLASLPQVEKWVAEAGLPDVVCRATDGEMGDPRAWRLPEISPDDTALLQYTSGSTSEPKGVMVSHRNLLSNVDAIMATTGADAGFRSGAWIPHHHDMGLIGLFLTGVLRGRGFAHMAPMAFLRRPHHWLRMMQELDVNMTAAPDFGYDLCTRRVTDEQLAGLDLSCLRAAVNGSEPIRSAGVARFCERFAAAGFRAESMLPMYGLAEATLMVSGTSGRPPLHRSFDVAALERGELVSADAGRALVGCGGPNEVDVAIVDPLTHETLPEARIGEIWLRGVSVAAGYWGDEKATAAAFRARTSDGDGPYLRTGDLGGMHDGDLYVTGRLKDTLVLHGRNLHPHDIEDLVREQHEELNGLHGAVFTVPGAHDEEQVVVVHEIRTTWGEERLAEVAAAMKQTVSREFGVAVGSVVLVRPSAVRRTTSGKVQRSAMRALYLAGELEPVLRSEDVLLTAARQAVTR